MILLSFSKTQKEVYCFESQKGKNRRSRAPKSDSCELEAFWGEDDDYMACFSNEYKVTEAMIVKDNVYILEEDQEMIGFFAIIDNDGISELELFYVDRALIGHGYGTVLWHHMVEFCKEAGIKKIEFVGSDDVVGFYEKIGAKALERIKSVLQVGRLVTRFEYEIK